MIRLTQYSHGAGCGCKISPAILDTILHSETKKTTDPRLIVGNDTRDDAAVYDLGDGTCLISTTDFFMPIVDDAFDFGRIASANAISDVYAMGGKPVLAIAILGWPIDKLAPEVAQQVLEGARSICAEAGIALAGGHSIDCPEPIFGLAVNGIVKKENLKQNSTASVGAKLYLTKPLGVGILTTAQKKGLLQEAHQTIAPMNMVQLNKLGAVVSEYAYVQAMTDVTGFGLLGHLSELCEGSGLKAIVYADKIPLLQQVDFYLEQGCVPGGTNRNWKSYGHKIAAIDDRMKHILADPQTSGGLLIAIHPDFCEAFETILREHNIPDSNCVAIGELHNEASATHLIEIR